MEKEKNELNMFMYMCDCVCVFVCDLRYVGLSRCTVSEQSNEMEAK